MGYVTIRIKATGQVTEMVPDVARALILGGSAEEVKPAARQALEEAQALIQAAARGRTESMVMAGAERAVTPAQDGPGKKPIFGRKR